MKLKDILTKETYDKWGDMDICNDVTDHMYCAWCGNLITEEGAQRFAEALDLPAEICPVWGAPGICVHFDDKHWKHQHNITAELFSALCGYCDCDDYDKWFYEPEEEGVVSLQPEMVVVNALIDHTSLDTLKDIARGPEGDRFLTALKAIGFDTTVIGG